MRVSCIAKRKALTRTGEGEGEDVIPRKGVTSLVAREPLPAKAFK